MPKTFYILSILLLAVTASAVTSNLSPELNGTVRLTKPQPIQESFQLALAADEWQESEKAEQSATSENDAPSYKSKSRLKALVLSALLPGAGEWYLGKKRAARTFFVAEAVLIIGYVSYRLAADGKRDDMIRYADTYANTSLSGKSEEFRDMVGFYENNDHYNSEGRVGDPDRPFYPDNAEYHWRWQSELEMTTYREIKNREGQLTQRANFVLTMAVLNRLISVINTAISSRGGAGSASEFAEEKRGPVRLGFNPTARSGQLTLTWQTNLF